MSIKLWRVQFNYLHGSNVVVVEVKANTKRKAIHKAKNKLAKSHGLTYPENCIISCCEEVNDDIPKVQLSSLYGEMLNP